MNEVKEEPMDEPTVEDEPIGRMVTKVDMLREQAAAATQANADIMQENGLSMGENNMQMSFNLMRIQVKVLMEMMCEDEEGMLLFEIACQEMIARDLVKAVEEIEAAKAKAALMDGVDLGSGIDLSALREKAGGMNRQQRRQMGRELGARIVRGE